MYILVVFSSLIYCLGMSKNYVMKWMTQAKYEMYFSYHDYKNSVW